MALLLPFGLKSLSDDKTTFNWGLVTVEGLAAYHAFGLDEDHSEGTRFRQSLVAWHVAAGILYGLEKWHDRRSGKKKTVILLPTDRGLEVRWVRPVRLLIRESTNLAESGGNGTSSHGATFVET